MDVRWQMVTCKRCVRTYQCTPADDYYGWPEDAPKPGPDEGVCFACLLWLSGHNPDTTAVRVIGTDGQEIDPREGLG